MSNFIHITPDFAVAGQLTSADLERAATRGFRTVINNRPDGEERGQPPADETRRLAEALGLGYSHIPTTRHDVFSDDVVERTAAVLADAAGPVLAHCKSGHRSAIVWAAVTARSLPIRDVLATLERAGIDLHAVRDDLEHQAERGADLIIRRHGTANAA